MVNIVTMAMTHYLSGGLAWKPRLHHALVNYRCLHENPTCLRELTIPCVIVDGISFHEFTLTQCEYKHFTSMIPINGNNYLYPINNIV